MTYNVFGGMLNLALSICLYIDKYRGRNAVWSRTQSVIGPLHCYMWTCRVVEVCGMLLCWNNVLLYSTAVIADKLWFDSCCVYEWNENVIFVFIFLLVCLMLILVY